MGVYDVSDEAVREGPVTGRVSIEVESLESQPFFQQGCKDRGALAAVRAHLDVVEVEAARGWHDCVKFRKY